MKKILLATALMCLLVAAHYADAQTTVKKVIFQSFWWDYKNDNYPNGWANYLTELAPRLKQIGVDMVWIPPISKGSSGTFDVGYGIFDNYDLGDKFQKGNVKTRIGTKDELLRMMAVMHANGIEVMQDIVGNQLNGAGDLSTGGIDPSAVTNNKYKNFRYTSFLKPATTQANATDSATEYLARDGRFSKNWQNFHDNPAHNGCEGNSGDDWCHELFGPDICYYDNAYGQSSNAIYNPTQAGGTNNGYMRKGMREWTIWLKKQTGYDGLRLDAAKNYEYAAAEDWLYNLQQLAGFASGTDSMIAVGEFVDGISNMDGWCNHVNNRAGTFDFNLRGGIKSMVDGGGFFDMSSLPSYQQNNRVQFYGGINAYVNRTIPFVNNHDTYRPILDASGNVTGWNSGNELAPHIDPINNARMPLAYACIFAMDGNPQLFFEDVFNLYNTSKRWSHLPTNTTDLPANAALTNIIWCHQNLQFKNGAYKVRSAESGFVLDGGSSIDDLLIIERSSKAIICLNDNGASDQGGTISCDFAVGTVLKDYSGHFPGTVTVTAGQKVHVYVSKVDAANQRWGYTVWAPVGHDADVYTPGRNTTTTQEWEMANDLGDSHCSSLGYGGALPANSTHQRVVGKIFAAAAKTLTVQISSATSPANILLSIWDLNGNKLIESIGTSPIIYTPVTDGWLTFKIRHSNTTTAAENVFVKAAYTAPAVVNTLAASNIASTNISIWTGNKNTTDITDCGNWEEGKLPSATTDVFIPAYSSPFPIINTNLAVKNITIDNGASLQINAGNTLSVNGNWVNNNTTPLSVCGKVAFTGSSLQQLYGQNTFCIVEINNAASVNAQNNDAVINQLILTNGNYILNNYNLSLQTGCTITGGSSTSYVKATNATTGGFLIQEINATPKNYPVGNTNYTPTTITNNGTTQNCQVRCFEDVLANGLTGSSLTSTEIIKKTWEITPLATGAIADIILNWNTSNELVTFNRNNCFAAKNTGTNWTQVSTQGPANGANPYYTSATGITTFSKFSVFSNTVVLPVQIVSFTGTANQNTANLNWHVGTPINVAKYVIEKSNDAVNFVSIGDVSQATVSSYSYTDNNFMANSWYRLTVVDADGKKTVSNIIFLRKGAQPQQFIITPNPVHSFIKINSDGVSNYENISMQMFNAAGLKIIEGTGNLSAIEKSINQKLSILSSGIFYVKLSTTTHSQILKILKQ